MAYFKQEEQNVPKNLKMREVLTSANDKDFFANFFLAKKNVQAIGYFGQVLSAITEAFAAYHLVSGEQTWRKIAGVLFAILVVWIFEVVGVRVLMLNAVRNIIKMRTEKPKVETVFLTVLTGLFAAVLIYASIMLSLSGKQISFVEKQDGTANAEKIARLYADRDKEIAAATAANAEANAQANAAFAEAEKNATTNYNAATKAENKRLRTEIETLNRAKWSAPNKAAIDNQIKTATEQNAKTLADLRTAHQEELKSLKERFLVTTAETEDISKKYEVQIAALEKTATVTTTTWQNVSRFADVLLVAFILISLVAIIYEQVFYSGAEVVVSIKEEEDKPSLIEMFLERTGHALYLLGFSLIAKIFGNKKYKYNVAFETVNFELKSKRKPQIAAQAGNQNEPQRQQIGFSNTVSNPVLNTDKSFVAQRVTNETDTENDSQNENDPDKKKREFWTMHDKNHLRLMWRRANGYDSNWKPVGAESQANNLKKYTELKSQAQSQGITWEEVCQTDGRKKITLLFGPMS